jgi:two-component system sensor histidine kinase GlrK
VLEVHRQLKDTQTQMERSAAQYLVLGDVNLKTDYLAFAKQMKQIILIINRITSDEKFKLLSLEYQTALLSISNNSLPLSEPNNANANSNISALQEKFNTLTIIHEKMTARSNHLLEKHVTAIKNSASSVRDLMYKSLLIIPFTLVIAAIFMRLITSPLKLLAGRILRLQHGEFEEKIVLSGSPEFQEIATALENMRTRLHALELQKSSFIRHISHELKTPLAAIREGTELLYDHSVGELNTEQQEISEIIKSSVSRLQQHIEDLLDFNIVLDSTSLQDSESLLISESIAQVLIDRKLDLKRKNINVAMNLDKIIVLTNAKQLSVVIDNILSNAIKYSPEQEEITITTQLQKQDVVLDITDRGIGIAAEVQDKIFDAFYQSTPPSSAHIKGSGLGLTIVKELLLRLNGTIKISSNTDGIGAKISITLPRASIAKELIS